MVVWTIFRPFWSSTLSDSTAATPQLNFQSRLNISISTFRIPPQKIGPWWVACLKFSQSHLKFFQSRREILIILNLWAVRETNFPGPETVRWCGGGLPHKGVRVQKLIPSLKLGENKHFLPGYCGKRCRDSLDHWQCFKSFCCGP